jgi:PAS domain S-box-containing protein
MNRETPDASDEPSNERTGATVLVLLASDGNETVLRDVLSTSYTVLVPEERGVPDETFDLCVLDERSLARYADALERRKKESRPVFLPYLLVTDRPYGEVVPQAVWRRIDGVVHKPISPDGLYNRIASQIRTRALSKQFARSEARFAALIRTATDAVFILDRTATIVFVNPAVEDVLGYDRHDLVGEPVTTLIPDRSREAAVAGIGRAFAGDAIGSIPSIEVRALHRDGHEIPVRLSYNRFSSDEAVFLAGVVHDVSDIAEREQRLRVLNRVLRHDIRNDVNVIRGWAERLRLTGENVPQYAEYIVRKADEIVHLSDQARQMEQLARSGEDALEPIDLVSRLGRQISRVRREHPNVEIRTDLPGRAAVVSLDLVDSAIDNVLENAIEHHDDDRPVIDVEVADTGSGEVELRVTDDGPGIPAEELAALERGDEDPLTHTSGLGLWITKWIVSESGGSVEFEDNDPSGTVVSMRFPAVEQEFRED